MTYQWLLRSAAVICVSSSQDPVPWIARPHDAAFCGMLAIHSD